MVEQTEEVAGSAELRAAVETEGKVCLPEPPAGVVRKVSLKVVREVEVTVVDWTAMGATAEATTVAVGTAEATTGVVGKEVEVLEEEATAMAARQAVEDLEEARKVCPLELEEVVATEGDAGGGVVKVVELKVAVVKVMGVRVVESMEVARKVADGMVVEVTGVALQAAV